MHTAASPKQKCYGLHLQREVFRLRRIYPPTPTDKRACRSSGGMRSGSAELKLIGPLLRSICINMMHTVASYLCRGIEVVITGLTRNQFVPKAHEGSNPSLCANKTTSGFCGSLFCFLNGIRTQPLRND